MKIKTINCLCGEKAKIKRKQICAGAATKYYYITCADENCKFEICTFGTRLLECAEELWRATLKKVKEMKNL
jgi:hypothetical protein